MVRQRYQDTLLFKGVDKLPLYLGLARESTLENWHKQGLPEEMDYQDYIADTLGFDRAALLRRNSLDIDIRLIPEFETQILKHEDGHYLIRDWSGAEVEISDQYDESYLRKAKDFVTRSWHKFPVNNRKDWEAIKGRYDPNDPHRLPADFDTRCKESNNRDDILILNLNGIFWQLREWCGLENLCMLMYDESDFVHEMAQFWSDFILAILNRVLPHIQFDSIFISEDMAYKAHPMISPEMTREFIQPAYNKWIPVIKKSGCPIIELDSDGYINDLIPIWIESGINCCSPIEVAAHCDIVNYRKKFGKQMAYLQGVDKRLIAKGGTVMEEHVTHVVSNLIREGGFIPGCDHGVPNDISWEKYLDFSRHLARLCGWL